jgi:hypothetical protein
MLKVGKEKKKKEKNGTGREKKKHLDHDAGEC